MSTTLNFCVASRMFRAVSAVLFGAGILLWAGGSFATPARGCAYDRPCISDVYETQSGGVLIRWDGQEQHSHYNVRWSRPGKSAVQVEVAGGQSGSFHLKNANSQTTYSFSIQGCNSRPLQSSRCSPWESTQFTTE